MIRRWRAPAVAQRLIARARAVQDRNPRLVRVVWVVATGVAVIYLVLQCPSLTAGPDSRAYWLTREGPLYDIPWNDRFSYVYSPAFAQLMWPMTQLPLQTFLIAWSALQLAALAWLVGPIPAALLIGAAGIPVVDTVAWNATSGNINTFIAVAVVVGLRWPAAWTFPLLTKTPAGVGILWYAGRREWRRLAVGVGVTMAIAVVSFVYWPEAWLEYIPATVANAGRPTLPLTLAIPLVIRLPAAAALAWYAGRSGRAWLVPIAVMLALPQVGRSAFIILLAIPRLVIGPVGRATIASKTSGE